MEQGKATLKSVKKELRLLQKADRIGRFKTGNALLTPDAYAVATDDAILWSDLDSGETRELDQSEKAFGDVLGARKRDEFAPGKDPFRWD